MSKRARLGHLGVSALRGATQLFIHRRMRIAIGFFLPMLVLGTVLYAIYHDFYIEQKEEWLLKVRISEVEYHLALESFDFLNSTVHGTLQMRFRHLPGEDELKQSRFLFSPLVLFDGSNNLYINGLKSRYISLAHVTLRARVGPFSENQPSPIKVELRALGTPKLYPFSAYLLVFATKCYIKTVTEKEGQYEESEFISRDNEELSVLQDIPGFFIRRLTLKEAKDMFYSPDVEDDFENWNRSNTFLLVLYPQLFMRVMTVFLGIVGFLSFIYVAFIGPRNEIPRKALGYFVGLWAVREVLTHGIPIWTIVDYGILLLYAILIGACGARLIWPSRVEQRDNS